MTALARIDSISIPGVPPEVAQKAFNRAVWSWYDDHKDERILHIKVLFLSKTFYIEDLTHLPLAGNLIARIAGPRQ